MNFNNNIFNHSFLRPTKEPVEGATKPPSLGKEPYSRTNCHCHREQGLETAIIIKMEQTISVPSWQWRSDGIDTKQSRTETAVVDKRTLSSGPRQIVVFVEIERNRNGTGIGPKWPLISIKSWRPKQDRRQPLSSNETDAVILTRIEDSRCRKKKRMLSFCTLSDPVRV
jgi:hypothetical protein